MNSDWETRAISLMSDLRDAYKSRHDACKIYWESPLNILTEDAAIRTSNAYNDALEAVEEFCGEGCGGDNE